MLTAMQNPSMTVPPLLAHWPNSPVPSTEQWANRCCAQLVARDDKLDLGEARVIAEDMSVREHWRRLVPEAAVDLLFDEVVGSQKSGTS